MPSDLLGPSKTVKNVKNSGKFENNVLENQKKLGKFCDRGPENHG